MVTYIQVSDELVNINVSCVKFLKHNSFEFHSPIPQLNIEFKSKTATQTQNGFSSNLIFNVKGYNYN